MRGESALFKLRELVFGAMPRVRQCARSIGLLSLLDRYSERRIVLYIRTLFAIGDSEDLMRLGACRLRFSTMDRVDAFLKNREGLVFEYGSGASTLWLSRRANRIVSIEHDRGIYELVKRHTADLNNVEVIHMPSRSARDGDRYVSNRFDCRGASFHEYVTSIERDSVLYDLILIDGRCREGCLSHALAHLKQDGLIVFDDAQRSRYRSAINSQTGINVEWVPGIAPANIFPGLTAFIIKA